MHTEFWANLSGPLADQVRSQLEVLRQLYERDAELHRIEEATRETIEHLRAQLLMRKPEHWLGRLHWIFESTHEGYRGSKPFVTFHVDPDHNQGAIEELHCLVGFDSNHTQTQTPVMDGIEVVMHDGMLSLNIPTDMLSSFLDAAEMTVDWSKLTQGIQALEKTIQGASRSLDTLRTIQFIQADSLDRGHS